MQPDHWKDVSEDALGRDDHAKDVILVHLHDVLDEMISLEPYDGPQGKRYWAPGPTVPDIDRDQRDPDRQIKEEVHPLEVKDGAQQPMRLGRQQHKLLDDLHDMLKHVR